MTNLIRNLFCTSLGKKYIMAVTGFSMVLFVAGHLAGNLQVFGRPEMINRYGDFLQHFELLWPIRLCLLAIITLHIWSAARLARENAVARPVDYVKWNPTAASYASQTMLMSGLIVLSFLVYHLLHYTLLIKAVNFTGQDFAAIPQFQDEKGRHDIFKMIVVGFNNPWASLIYIVGVGLLCLHLSHGISAMFQSLGWKKRGYGDCLDRIAQFGSILIFLGYISIPIAILLGYGHEYAKELLK